METRPARAVALRRISKFIYNWNGGDDDDEHDEEEEGRSIRSGAQSPPPYHSHESYEELEVSEDLETPVVPRFELDAGHDRNLDRRAPVPSCAT
jgi:hypothetical protein